MKDTQNSSKTPPPPALNSDIYQNMSDTTNERLIDSDTTNERLTDSDTTNERLTESDTTNKRLVNVPAVYRTKAIQPVRDWLIAIWPMRYRLKFQLY